MKEPIVTEIKIIPIDTAITSLSRYVAACFDDRRHKSVTQASQANKSGGKCSDG